MISGALLGINTGIGNRMQSIFSGLVEMGTKGEARTAYILNSFFFFHTVDAVKV